MKKLKRPKPVTYTLIPEQSDIGLPMYERLCAILDEHHVELSRSNVRIALAWCTSWKADVDGRLMLGKCKKASDLDRELAPFDFVILLNRDFWQNPNISDTQRDALLDHELMHAAIAYDERGDPKVDERGRTVYRIRRHDLEEFADIASRYGCWKRDIEDFARALGRAERVSIAWVGYTGLRDALNAAGVNVEAEIIATWDESDRREAMRWALLSHEMAKKIAPAGSTVSVVMPAFLTNALKAQPTPAITPQEATH